MTLSTAEMREQTRLRRAAEQLLAQGVAPPTRGWELGTDALALLYRLASDMSTSDDALAVLHELQVHQVELDLQLEQLEANEDELSDKLQRYRDLYELAPVGYLRVCPEGRILRANQIARQLLAALPGVKTIESERPRLFDLIRSEDRAALSAMLHQLGADDATAFCEVRGIDAAADATSLRITARRESNSDNLWVVVS